MVCERFASLDVSACCSFDVAVAGCVHRQRHRRIRHAALRKRRSSRAAGNLKFNLLFVRAACHCISCSNILSSQVPATEKMGRVHTSTATVAVMPVPQESEVVINNSDLKIDT